MTLGLRTRAPLARRRPISEWTAVAAVVALAAGLRLYRLTADPLDIDEGYSLWLARLALRDLWDRLAALDNHPPLFYLLLHGWVRVWGESEGALRGLPVLLGTATVLPVYVAGRAAGDHTLGLIAAGLAAISPPLVQWSQELRMYALATAAIAAGMAGLALLCGDGAPAPYRLRGWMLYGLGVVAAIWSLYSAAAFVAAAAPVFMWILATAPARRRPRFAAEWIVVHLLITAACVPVARLLIEQWRGPNVVNWYPFTWRILIGTFGTVFAGAAFVGSPLRILVYVLGLGSGLLGLWAARRAPVRGLLPVSLGLVPVAGTALVAARVHPVFAPRGLVWTALPLALLLASGLRVLRPRPVAAGAAAVVIAVSVAGLAAHWRDRSADALRGYDRVAAIIGASARPRDVVLVFVPYVQPTVEYYLRRVGRPLETRGVPVSFGQGGRMFPPLTPEDIHRMQEDLRGRDRAWFVWGMLPSAAPVLEALGELGTMRHEHRVNVALRVYLFELPR